MESGKALFQVPTSFDHEYVTRSCTNSYPGHACGRRKCGLDVRLKQVVYLSELFLVGHTVSVVALTFSLKPRLSALDFVSQLWRKINLEQRP